MEERRLRTISRHTPVGIDEYLLHKLAKIIAISCIPGQLSCDIGFITPDKARICRLVAAKAGVDVKPVSIMGFALQSVIYPYDSL